jgi:hypothetical protein
VWREVDELGQEGNGASTACAQGGMGVPDLEPEAEPPDPEPPDVPEPGPPEVPDPEPPDVPEPGPPDVPGPEYPNVLGHGLPDTPSPELSDGSDPEPPDRPDSESPGIPPGRSELWGERKEGRGHVCSSNPRRRVGLRKRRAPVRLDL